MKRSDTLGCKSETRARVWVLSCSGATLDVATSGTARFCVC